MDRGRIQLSKMNDVAFGLPVDQGIVQACDDAGAGRVFLIASGTLTRETDVISSVRDRLGGRVVGQFSAMPPHTPRRAVIETTRLVRESKAEAIVTIGGGSVTDGAKAVRLCLANDIDTPEAIDRLSGSDVVASGIAQITAPTTLSGGEFSEFSGVTNERTASKEILKHPSMMSRSVILDPAITVHTPQWLWLSTGIRAVDHCVEGICSNEANPYADAQAEKGLALLAEGLPAVKRDPSDIEARLKCQMGTWLSMGPLASGVPMGASHGIGYVLGAAFEIPHGYTSCVMLPAVMRWNESVNADRQDRVAAAMGHPGENAGEVLDSFIRELGLPRSLQEVEVPTDRYGDIAEQSLATPWVPRNPRPVAGANEVMEILALASDKTAFNMQ